MGVFLRRWDTEARFAVPPMDDLVIYNRDLTAEELQELIKK